jgi:hypothetical protein
MVGLGVTDPAIDGAGSQESLTTSGGIYRVAAEFGLQWNLARGVFLEGHGVIRTLSLASHRKQKLNQLKVKEGALSAFMTLHPKGGLASGTAGPYLEFCRGLLFLQLCCTSVALVSFPSSEAVGLVVRTASLPGRLPSCDMGACDSTSLSQRSHPTPVSWFVEKDRMRSSVSSA